MSRRLVKLVGLVECAVSGTEGGVRDAPSTMFVYQCSILPLCRLVKQHKGWDTSFRRDQGSDTDQTKLLSNSVERAQYEETFCQCGRV
jgi:hypothetical protein